MILLDAFAVIAYLKAEPVVAPRVKRLLLPRQGQRQPVAISALNSAEVIDHLVRGCDVDPDDSVADVAQLGLLTVDVDERISRRAGLLRAQHYHARRRPVSLADCVAAATLLLLPQLDALATADGDLLDLVHAEGGGVRPLPRTDGTMWSPRK